MYYTISVCRLFFQIIQNDWDMKLWWLTTPIMIIGKWENWQWSLWKVNLRSCPLPTMKSCQMSAKIMCTAHFYFATTITQDDDKECTKTEWAMDAEECESGDIVSKKFYQKAIFHSEFDCWWHRLLCFSFPNQMQWDDQFLQSGSISRRLWGRRQEEQEKMSGRNLHRPLLISPSDSDCLPPICRPFPRSTRS